MYVVVVSCLPDIPGLAQADMNVSLTAISLLWNAADLLSKLSSAPAAANGGGAPLAALNGAQFEELLRVLFVALQVQITSGPPCLSSQTFKRVGRTHP